MFLKREVRAGRGLGQFPKIKFLHCKTLREKIVSGEPWGRKIKQVPSTNQVLCRTFKENSCTSYCPTKKLVHNLKVREKSVNPRKLPDPHKPLKFVLRVAVTGWCLFWSQWRWKFFRFVISIWFSRLVISWTAVYVIFIICFLGPIR